MAQRHPHADAKYRVVPQSDMTFAVEVAIPGASLAMVTRFATEQKAEAWINGHMQRVKEGSFYRSTMRRQTPRTPSS